VTKNILCAAGNSQFAEGTHKNTSFRMKLGTRALGGLGAAGLGLGIIYSYAKYRVEQSYTGIFTRFHMKPYYDRDSLKKDLRAQINRDTPGGIIFVCGRVNNGKTSLIKSVVQDRKYVAYLNWRSKPDIWESDKLVKDLKCTFKIASFLDSIPGLSKLSAMVDWIPRIRQQEANSDKLEDVLEQIEDVLRYAYQRSNGDVRDRPVIFIDEVHHLMPPNGNHSLSSHKFVNWLVEMSKDNHYCDVVVSTTDANSKALFSLSNPRYVSTITVDDLRKEDFEIIIKEYWKEKGKGQKPPAWLGSAAVEKAIAEVGGTAGSVIDLCTAPTEISYHKKLVDLRRQEKERFDNMVNEAKPRCGYFKRTNNCYTFEEFKKVANLIIAKGGNELDPQVPIGTLARESGVSEDIIWHFIRSNYLFAQARDTSNKFPVQFSSKLFMDVFKEDVAPKIRADKLTREIETMKASLNRQTFEFESERQDYVRHIRDLEEELKSLGK
jgi:hypothetical protein